MLDAYEGPVFLTGQTIRDGDPEEIADLMFHLSGRKTRPKLLRFDCEVILAGGVHWPVIRYDGHIVAMAIMTSYRLAQYPARRFGYVNDVATHPDHENRGLGGRIMQALFQVGLRDKYAHIDWTSSKYGAQRFYESERMKCAGVVVRATKVYRWTPESVPDPAAAI